MNVDGGALIRVDFWLFGRAGWLLVSSYAKASAILLLVSWYFLFHYFHGMSKNMNNTSSPELCQWLEVMKKLFLSPYKIPVEEA